MKIGVATCLMLMLCFSLHPLYSQDAKKTTVLIEVVELTGKGQIPVQLKERRSLGGKEGALEAAFALLKSDPESQLQIAEYLSLRGPFSEQLSARASRPRKIKVISKKEGKETEAELVLHFGITATTTAELEGDSVALRLTYQNAQVDDAAKIANKTTEIPGMRTRTFSTSLKLKNGETTLVSGARHAATENKGESKTWHLVLASAKVTGQ